MLPRLRALRHRLLGRLQRGVPRSVDLVIGSLASAVLIWLFAAANLFYYPQVSAPEKADAVVVLAGAASERLPVGRQLVHGNYAPELVLSSTDTPGNRITDLYCDYNAGDKISEDRASAAVTCFFPEPTTTRGEARAIARLAADNDWDNLIVVTSRYHLLRAETNISQCTTAELTMVGSGPELSPMQWLGRFVEETGGLAAAVLRPACASRI